MTCFFNCLVPEFGDMKIRDIKRQHISVYLEDLGKDVPAGTNRAHIQVHQVWYHPSGWMSARSEISLEVVRQYTEQWINYSLSFFKILENRCGIILPRVEFQGLHVEIWFVLQH